MAAPLAAQNGSLLEASDSLLTEQVEMPGMARFRWLNLSEMKLSLGFSYVPGK